MSKVSIFKFNDGYYAIGREGEKKTFVPTLDLALTVLEYYGETLHLTGELQIKNVERSLKENFNE